MLAKLFHRSHFDMMFYVKDCVCVWYVLGGGARKVPSDSSVSFALTEITSHPASELLFCIQQQEV